MNTLETPPIHDKHNPFEPVLPRRVGETLHWRRLAGSALGLAASRTARRHNGPVLLITADTPEATRLEYELRFFTGDDQALPVLHFPDWETLPYDNFSPHQDIVSQRLATLYRLPALERGLLVVPVNTLIQRLAPRSYLQGNSLVLDTGERLDLEAMRQRLEASGYRYVSQVMEHGEFAVRGSLLDLFPMGSNLPYRIDLFDEHVDSIRTFDPENQRSLDTVSSIRLLPAREFPLNEDAISQFRQAYRLTFEGNPQKSAIYRGVSEGSAPPGIEYYLPLFFNETASLFDYLAADTLVITTPGVTEALDKVWDEINTRYESLRHDLERPLLAPAQAFFAPPEITARSAHHPLISVATLNADHHAYAFATTPPPPLPIVARAERPAEALLKFLGDFSGRVLFAAETPGRRETLLDLLKGHDLHPSSFDSWRAFAEGDARLGITVAPLEQGLLVETPPLAIISEAQLFGEQAVQRRRRKTARTRDADALIRDLTELNPGAPVVHEEHGVGRYLGMQTLEVGGITTEFITLEYAGGDKLYVPVSSLHLISRYSGAAPEQAPLHRLGSEQWIKAKRRAAEKVRDVAAELLDIYARRAARQGHAFPEPDMHYRSFASTFPFEETPDQQTAIDAVLDDMRKTQPMDRLVCGDVGFGKTEVAMRAAFMAVHNGKQVAVLVPTTLLAQQHYQNFQDRFADWPVKVESLSRFRSAKEQEAVLKGLADGKVDIVIGTHKLLQSRIEFKRLGLVIVDEEHRFGVRQKEWLKSLRSEVHILTLTATPIPRTMNMALSGMRDLSIIATPPSRRMSIKTFVREWDQGLMREACLRELKRGGQVFFLHNEVKSIEKAARDLAALVPEARVQIAHGQMRERELEQVMLDFYHHRFNILVCTTIIETGIDIPNANTIIIRDADHFGLAQLHQLRGRVGRSHHQAYAYLVVPPRKLITADAIKRLEAIEALEDLGAGFTLATHDLEIRGAGELLGDEQSGQMHEIGFTLYTQLLERAVKALKAGRQPELEVPLNHGGEIDLRIPALIPEDYLPDVHSRLVMYKRIASAENDDALRELQVEMIDRFGLLPEPAKNLIRITELKLKAQAMGVRKIEAGPYGGRILFDKQPKIDPVMVIRLIQTQPKIYKLDGQDKLRFTLNLEDREMRFQSVEKLLEMLAVREAA
ncbi:MAG: transcription-repair coupling factor [Pseudomonadota bacterium]